MAFELHLPNPGTVNLEALLLEHASLSNANRVRTAVPALFPPNLEDLPVTDRAICAAQMNQASFVLELGDLPHNTNRVFHAIRLTLER